MINLWNLLSKENHGSFSHFYAKSENNINIDINEYNNLVDLLGSLNMYSYVLVDKTREVYTKKENEIEYNVIVDKIKNIGVFVEFELLTNE